MKRKVIKVKWGNIIILLNIIISIILFVTLDDNIKNNMLKLGAMLLLTLLSIAIDSVKKY